MQSNTRVIRKKNIITWSYNQLKKLADANKNNVPPQISETLTKLKSFQKEATWSDYDPSANIRYVLAIMSEEDFNKTKEKEQPILVKKPDETYHLQGWLNNKWALREIKKVPEEWRNKTAVRIEPTNVGLLEGNHSSPWAHDLNLIGDIRSILITQETSFMRTEEDQPHYKKDFYDVVEAMLLGLTEQWPQNSFAETDVPANPNPSPNSLAFYPRVSDLEQAFEEESKPVPPTGAAPPAILPPTSSNKVYAPECSVSLVCLTTVKNEANDVNPFAFLTLGGRQFDATKYTPWSVQNAYPPATRDYRNFSKQTEAPLTVEQKSICRFLAGKHFFEAYLTPAIMFMVGGAACGFIIMFLPLFLPLPALLCTSFIESSFGLSFLVVEVWLFAFGLEQCIGLPAILSHGLNLAKKIINLSIEDQENINFSKKIGAYCGLAIGHLFFSLFYVWLFILSPNLASIMIVAFLPVVCLAAIVGSEIGFHRALKAIQNLKIAELFKTLDDNTDTEIPSSAHVTNRCYRFFSRFTINKSSQSQNNGVQNIDGRALSPS